jgi:SRSO17 transposase
MATGSQVPDEVGFATKPELARAMIERVVTAGLLFGWVAADEFYGDNPRPARLAGEPADPLCDGGVL